MNSMDFFGAMIFVLSEIMASITLRSTAFDPELLMIFGFLIVPSGSRVIRISTVFRFSEPAPAELGGFQFDRIFDLRSAITQAYWFSLILPDRLGGFFLCRLPVRFFQDRSFVLP